MQVDYETFTQTTRIEKCLTAGEPCPLVPQCYESSCLQKSVYHRSVPLKASYHRSVPQKASYHR